MTNAIAISEINTSETLKLPYRRILTPDPSGGFTATIHEFPGCIGYGETADLAIQDLERNAESWIAAAKETGYPIPEPVEYSEFSGKIALRISRRLHKMAAERSAIEGVSTNQMLSVAVAHYLGQRDGIEVAVKGLNESMTRMSAMAYAHPLMVMLSDRYVRVISNHPQRLERKATIGSMSMPANAWYPFESKQVTTNG